MPNRRELKADINNEFNDIIDQAYSYMLYNPGKKDKEVNEMIDESAEFLDDVMHRINNHSEKEGKEVKKHFKEIQADFQKKSSEIRQRVDKL